MMPNVTKGAKPVGLMSYLFGPGRNNEHVDQHAVAGSASMMVFAPDGEVSKDQAVMLGRELDRARRAHDVDTRVMRRGRAEELVRSGAVATASAAVEEATVEHNVWHCSLSLHPDEKPLTDEKWAAVSHRFMELMEFHSPDPASPETRWLAIRHGLSGTPDAETRNDHIHIAASTVRNDGSRLDTRRDWSRAQSAAASVEREFGLRITTGRDARLTSKGTAPAQEHRRARTGSYETARAELARTVRATAAAAESEAEFVRLSRAHGLLIRPRYADATKTTVTGFSVALPTDRYATKTGAPVWHGGGKLGNDLTLPRLRETWLADGASAVDAESAWAHNHRERIDPTTPVPTPRRAQPTNTLSFGEARDRLRDTVSELALRSPTEADFVGEVLSHRDLLIRPRYAPGSTTDVTGYSVALRPHLYARDDGQPQWHGGGKLDASLNLSTMRGHWRAETDPRILHSEWARAAGRSGVRRDQWEPATAAAGRWANKVAGVSPKASDAAWATAAGDTAAAVSAWAIRADPDRARHLAPLADALADAGGHQRSPREAGAQAASAARRAAAMILAASHDNPTQAYLVMFAQIAAAARAVADAAEARGHAARAVAIRGALTEARIHYPVTPTPTRAATVSAVRAAPVRSQRPRRDEDLGR